MARPFELWGLARRLTSRGPSRAALRGRAQVTVIRLAADLRPFSRAERARAVREPPMDRGARRQAAETVQSEAARQSSLPPAELAPGAAPFR